MSDQNNKKQLVIIGAGPGGYPAAFLAADKGMDVALIDVEENPGGVCLFRGCIPTKTLLHVSKIIREAKEAKKWGVSFTDPALDLEGIRSWKNSVVQKLTGGLGQLCKQRGIQYIQGKAKFINGQTLEIESTNGDDSTLSFKNAIIATGTSPAKLPNISYDSTRIMNSAEAMEFYRY